MSNKNIFIVSSYCKEGYLYIKEDSKCLNLNPTGFFEADAAQNAGYVTTALIAGGIALSSVSLILAGGSSQGLFSAVNMFQLLLLFPLFRFFIPKVLIKFYESLDWTVLSFSFISLSEVPVLSEAWKSFEDEQEDVYLNIIGIEQKSSLLSIFS